MAPAARLRWQHLFVISLGWREANRMHSLGSSRTAALASRRSFLGRLRGGFEPPVLLGEAA